VRALVIEAFSAAELQQLRQASERMIARIDAQHRSQPGNSASP
jgi:hypothetical protein